MMLGARIVEGWGECQECGSLYPLTSLTERPDKLHYCSDRGQCERFKRIRLEVMTEFNRAHYSDVERRQEEAYEQLKEFKRERKRRSRGTKTISPPPSGVCPGCGKRWERVALTGRGKTWCSTVCRQKATRQRQKINVNQSTKVLVTCKECAKDVVGRRQDALFCSAKCGRVFKEHSRRSRKQAVRLGFADKVLTLR